MGNRAVVLKLITSRIAADREAQFPIFLHEKDETSLRAGDAQRSLDQGHQHVVQSATAVEFTSDFEEESELFEVRGFFFNLKPGNLAQQVSGGAAGLRRRSILEDNKVAIVVAAELNAIVI